MCYMVIKQHGNLNWKFFYEMRVDVSRKSLGCCLLGKEEKNKFEGRGYGSHCAVVSLTIAPEQMEYDDGF